MCSVCTAVPGLILASSSLATAQQYPGHPDEGMAKAAKVVNWIAIGLAIVIILLYVVFFVILIGIGASSGEL
jgi:ABC-type Fe3+ transport system permease subunit